MWDYEVASEFNFPNIVVYRLLKDGVLTGWRFISNEGCVMYDTSANATGLSRDPETGEIIFDPETGLPVIIPTVYYYTNVDCPLNYNWDNFTWVAVPRDTVSADHIFGNDDFEQLAEGKTSEGITEITLEKYEEIFKTEADEVLE